MSDSGVACGYVDFDDETLAKIEASDDNLAKKKAGVSSAHTMQTYAGYLAESSLISLVRRYSSKPVERIRNEKLYISDMISGVFGRRFFFIQL